MNSLGVLWLAVSLQVVASAQTAVYVKFLDPPRGYRHNLHIATKGGVAVAREERIYPGDERFQQPWVQQPRFQQQSSYQPQNRYLPSPTPAPATSAPYPPPAQSSYYYPSPARPFDEYGPPPASRQYQAEQLNEFGEFVNPGLSPNYRTEMAYDPHLITGPQAAQYVAFLFSRGELFFHLIPHERLVLMNQDDRIQNNLMPHILASIRPGHPFFYH